MRSTDHPAKTADSRGPTVGLSVPGIGRATRSPIGAEIQPRIGRIGDPRAVRRDRDKLAGRCCQSPHPAGSPKVNCATSGCAWNWSQHPHAAPTIAAVTAAAASGGSTRCQRERGAAATFAVAGRVPRLPSSRKTNCRCGDVRDALPSIFHKASLNQRANGVGDVGREYASSRVRSSESRRASR